MPQGITASEKRHTVMSAFRPPFVSVKQLRAFLGVVMWYKNFIPHVASIAAPLFEKTSKRKLVWDDEATRAINRLKEALIELPMLVRFDRELQTRVTMDASTGWSGCCLGTTPWGRLETRGVLEQETKGRGNSVLCHKPGMAGSCGICLACLETLSGGPTFLFMI